MNVLRNVLFCMVALVLCLGLTACGENKVTQENFKKLKNEMKESEVTKIMGPPTETKEEDVPLFGKAKVSIWKSGDNVISVFFIDDKAIKIDGKFSN